MTRQSDPIATEIETDHGPHSAGQARFCAVARATRPIDELIRFVAGPQGLVPDLKRKLPGRGVWVTGTRDAIAAAVKRGVFKRGFKTEVNVPPDLPELVERLLVRSALDALAIAYKAGQVTPGYIRVEQAIADDAVHALIHAADAGFDGTRKLAAAIKRRHGDDGHKVATIRAFTSAQLDLALGRPNVVHAALLAGRAGETFLARWRDLERFRMAGDDTGQCGGSAPPAKVAQELELG